MGAAPCAWAIQAGEAHANCVYWGDECARKGCGRKRQAAQRRKAELAAYRKFPGNDIQQARRARIEAAIAPLGPAPAYSHGEDSPWAKWIDERNRLAEAHQLTRGHCSWCEGEIMKPDAPVLNLQRGWHDGRGQEPDCLGDYFRHTRQPEQLAHIIRRDGTRCAACGVDQGRWTAGANMTPERAAAMGPAGARRYPPDTYAGPWTAIQVAAALDVDHRLALGLVVLTIAPADQWRYWGPMNLQGLCHGCHKIKTRADVVAIKAARAAQPKETA